MFCRARRGRLSLRVGGSLAGRNDREVARSFIDRTVARSRAYWFCLASSVRVPELPSSSLWSPLGGALVFGAHSHWRVSNLPCSHLAFGGMDLAPRSVAARIVTQGRQHGPSVDDGDRRHTVKEVQVQGRWTARRGMVA